MCMCIVEGVVVAFKCTDVVLKELQWCRRDGGRTCRLLV